MGICPEPGKENTEYRHRQFFCCGIKPDALQHKSKATEWAGRSVYIQHSTAEQTRQDFNYEKNINRRWAAADSEKTFRLFLNTCHFSFDPFLFP